MLLIMSSPATTLAAPEGPSAPHARAWLGISVMALIIGTIFVAVYVGVQRSPTPRHLPLAVSSQLASAAEKGWGDEATVTAVSSTAAGERLVREGRAVGVLAPGTSTDLQFDYAGAKGLSETAAARALVKGFASQAGVTVAEKDIVPLVEYDSRGLVSFYVSFGVTLSSFVLAQGLTGAASRIRLRHRLYAIGGFAVVIGSIAATIAGPVYETLPAPWILLATTLALLSAAVAFSTKALAMWLGAPGIGLAVLLMTTVGNAISGATIGFDILPAWAQFLSPVLPPGAAVRALNDLGYFTASGSWSSLVVLLLWAGAGFALVLVEAARRPKVAHVPAHRSTAPPVAEVVA